MSHAHITTRARYAVAAAVGRASERFPDLPPSVIELGPLSPAERQLAISVHRTTLQRWLTLEYLIDRVSKTPVFKMEPMLRGVMLSGAAQVLFLPAPAYAVVDESVDVAKSLVRPGAKGLVNAVLRKLADMVDRVEEGEAWAPSRDRIPRDGGVMVLKGVSLPHPANLAKHLPAATSVGEPLVTKWLKRVGAAEATRLCAHTTQNPPTTVVCEPGFDRSIASDTWTPHEADDFIVWKGGYEPMTEFLAANPARRVQDPAARSAAEVARDLRPASILDYCAGRGTKSRQLAIMHPQASVFASDIDDVRRAAIEEANIGFANIRVVPLHEARRQPVDLLLLDVPCSNTGVLARRPEAKYRFSDRTLGDLVALQRRIIDETLPTVNPGGHVLYTTCSAEREENEMQARFIAERTGGRIVREGRLDPAGRGTTYHDGSYHALISTP